MQGRLNEWIDSVVSVTARRRRVRAGTPQALVLATCLLLHSAGAALAAGNADTGKPGGCLDVLPPSVAGDDPVRRGLYLRTITTDRWAAWQQEPPGAAWLRDQVAAVADLDALRERGRAMVGESSPRVAAIDAAWFLANRDPAAAEPFFQCLGASGVILRPRDMTRLGDREQITLEIVVGEAPATPPQLQWASVNAIAVTPWPMSAAPGSVASVAVERTVGADVTVMVRVDGEDGVRHVVWRDVPWTF
jgi:hypothetical protein